MSSDFENTRHDINLNSTLNQFIMKSTNVNEEHELDTQF